MSDKERKVSTNWIVFLLVTLVCVIVAGAVLLRGRVGVGGGSGEILTASTGWGTTHFSNLSAADIEVTDDLTVTDDASVGGLLTVGEYEIFTEQSVVVCTEGAPITATGTYQPITSTAAITTSTTCAVYSGTVAGQIVFLVNENASDAIIVDDGANTDLGGNVTLGSGDILKLLWDGANWLGLGTANN